MPIGISEEHEDLRRSVRSWVDRHGGNRAAREALTGQEDVLPGVMRRFEDAGIRVAELNLRGSSLDEVFLSLTGHRTETDVLEGIAA